MSNHRVHDLPRTAEAQSHQDAQTVGLPMPRTDKTGDAPHRPLRVALVTPLGKGGKGGMDRLADLVIDHVAATDPDGIAITRITTKGGISKLKGAFYFTRALAELFVMLLFRRLDVIHINLAAYGSFYRKSLIAGLAELFAVPYVVHIHSGRFQPFWTEAKGWKLHLINRFMKKSAAIIVLGRVYRELVETMVPECSDRLILLPNATPSRPPRSGTDTSSARPLQITFLGLLADFKGIPQLLRALTQLTQRDNWHATLAGHGDVTGTRERAEALGLSSRVTIPGWLGAADVASLLDRTDIFVLPSFSEGQPMSILEAFAASAAVIATPVNAVVDVVENERNGLLVTPGDVDGLKAAIERLLNDTTLRETLARNGFADHRAKYAVEAHVARLTDIWQNAATTRTN